MIELINSVPAILKAGAAVLGAVSALATLLAHLPLPARAAALCARIGVASGKFSVAQRPS